MVTIPSHRFYGWPDFSARLTHRRKHGKVQTFGGKGSQEGRRVRESTQPEPTGKKKKKKREGKKKKNKQQKSFTQRHREVADQRDQFNSVRDEVGPPVQQ